ncbi:MAG: transglutaminase domain-containing protein [Candidatus Eisenbacteria bacterium]|nr:transglutaminase domain-containing protein [Candidatus Eisenbacteria bacterium]
MRLRLALVAAATLLLPAGSLAQGGEAWFAYRLGGIHVGHARETVSVRPDGAIATTAHTEFLIRRGDDLAAMSVSEEWIETADGAPVAYHASRVLSGESRELRVTIDGDTLLVATDAGGEAAERAVPVDGQLLFPRAVDALHAARGLVAGDAYAFSYFDTDFERVGRAEVLVVGEDAVAVMGEERGLVKLVVRSDLLAGIETIEWRDRRGRLWRSEVPAAGLTQERADPEQAVVGGAPGDLAARLAVPSNVRLDAPWAVDWAVYELWTEDGEGALFVPEDGRQTLEGVTEQGVLLRVVRAAPDAAAPGGRDTGGGATAAYLESNALLQTGYPPLAAAAARAAQAAGDDPWRKATAIEAFVHEHIENKGFGTAFGSAAEVLSNRSGDCSEHAVLMAAMTRAVGVPSKLVAGLAYADGVFAYHMWVEVWAGGGWYALDPTLAAGNVDATHIKLAESAAEGGVTADISVGILRALSRLRLRVVDWGTGG